MTHATEPQYATVQKYANEHAQAKYAYLRWLMLLAAGAFSLTASIVLAKPFPASPLLVLKAALSANLIGILFGSTAVCGEVRRANEGLRLASKQLANSFDQPNTVESTEQHVSSSPPWQCWVERAFYYSLLSSLALWVVFVWL